MRAGFMLCDFAEVVNGKLYMQGAGFQMVGAGRPVNIAIGLLINVDWNETNQLHTLAFRLLDSDGNQVHQPGGPIQATGELRAGRPPTAKPGSSFNVPMAITFPGLVLPPGGYVVELVVNEGKSNAMRLTEAVEAIAGPAPPT